MFGHQFKSSKLKHESNEGCDEDEKDEMPERLTNSSTPRSLGSPPQAALSITPQINLQELPGTPLPQPGGSLSQSSNSHQQHAAAHAAAALLAQHHGQQSTTHVVAGSHVDHLAQQLSIHHQQHHHHHQQQQQQQHSHHHHHQLQQQHLAHMQGMLPDDLEIKPGIAEMIREEERVS